MKEIKTIIGEALGEASVLFMSQECKGTEIIMPDQELSAIVDRVIIEIDIDKTIEKIIKETNEAMPVQAPEDTKKEIDQAYREILQKYLK